MKIQTLFIILISAFIFLSCKNKGGAVDRKLIPELEESTGQIDINAEDPKPVKVKDNHSPLGNKEAKETKSPSSPDENNTEATPTKPGSKSNPVKSAEKLIPVPEVPSVDEPKEKDQPPSSFSHDIWDGLTKKHVSSSGKVNYSGFKNDIAQLDAYLALLKANPPAGSRSNQLAYWINVYNAYTVKLIADNYPVSSITKLHGGQPWKVKWVEVNGKTYSLDEVENLVIRPEFNDSRIHFAVNCAAKSCPPLLNRAWTSSILERYLEQQTKNFINNTAHNQIDDNSAKLSKIFEWYAVDFGDIITYINKYSDSKVKPGSKVTFNEYDWSLND